MNNIKNKTITTISRNDASYKTVKGKVTLYPSILLQAYRYNTKGNKVHLKRRFTSSKFGNLANATNEANNFAVYISSVSNKQFKQATRPIGRPRKSHYFAASNIQAA